MSPERRRLHRRLLWALALPALAALLAACSSGGGGIRIVAITATPGAQGTVAPGSSTPAAPGAPRAVPLPPRPANPFAGGAAVAEYLAGGRANIAECLPELVFDWGLSDIEGQRCVSLDIDGDGRDEFVFVISLPGEPGPADIWFFHGPDQGYRYFNSARAIANTAISGVQIRDVRDLTGDGTQDIVISYETCGATTCLTEVVITSNHNGVIENLAPRDIPVESLEEFAITDGGEIRMTGGLIQSDGAGPQRKKLVTIVWSGAGFRSIVEDEEPSYLIHLINDADAAFLRGDYPQARVFFEQASRDFVLRDWKFEVGRGSTREELHAYSLFRASLSAQRQGDGASMLTLLDAAIEGRAHTMHGGGAAVYREALRNGNTPETACAAAEAYLGLYQAALRSFWDYGFANPDRDVFTICR